MARGLQHGDVQPGKMEPGAFRIGLGMVQDAGGELLGQRQILGADVDLTAGVRGQIPHGAHMVKVAVGQHNGLQRQPQGIQSVQNGFRVVPGINDTARRAVLFVNDVAVGLVSAHDQGMNDKHSSSSLGQDLLGVSIS